MMKPVDHIRIQMSLEYQLDSNGLLLPFPNSSEQAWYLIYRKTDSTMPFFNHHLPSDLPRVFSRQVVAAWAHDIYNSGRVPF